MLKARSLANKQGLWLREKVVTHEKSSHKSVSQAGEYEVFLGCWTPWTKKINTKLVRAFNYSYGERLPQFELVGEQSL